MTARKRSPSFALLALALAGCASTNAVPTPASTAKSPLTSPAMSVRQPSASASATEPSAAAPGSGPSAAAQMICGPETNGHIATLVGISAPVPATSTWADRLYTCTYDVRAAALVLSVKSAADPASARSYFDQLAAKLHPTERLQGLATLGLPSFKTSAGTVVFLKDDDILTVDATALPAEIGTQGETRDDLAYTVATDILACWTGK